MTTPSSVRAGSGTVLHRPILVDDSPGTSWLLVTIDGTPVPSSKLGPVTIRHGRAQAEDPAEPGTCQLMLHTDALPQLPSIGSQVRVELSDLAFTALAMTEAQRSASMVRFVGDITDLALLEATGDPTADGYLTLVAVGPAARLGRVTIADEPWPDERDGARAGRILTLASRSTGAPVRTVDTGTVTVGGQDVDSQAPLDLLAALATASRGQLHLSRDGSLSWHDAQHRRGEPTAATLTAAQMLRSTRWAQDLAGVVNDVTVTYTDVNGEASERVQDPASVDRFGRLGARLSTTLTGASDANGLAAQLVGRRSTPAWRIGQLAVELRRTVPAGTAAQLLTAEPGALLELTGLPSYGPAATAKVYAEGWYESVTADGWSVVFDTAPYALLSAGPRWIDLDPALSWDELADLTWLDFAATDPT